MNLLGFGKQNLPSVIKDPFSKTKVKSLSVFYRESWSGEGWEASGTVYFENGDTKGEQKFKGDTFDDVVLQIKAMLDNLK